MKETTGLSLTVFQAPRWWEEGNRYTFDNKTHRRVNMKTWEEMKSMFYLLSKRKLEKKLDAELISPATYLPDTTRANKNVVSWGGWAAVDVDEWEFDGRDSDENPERVVREKLSGLFGKDGIRYLVYSTASSKPDKPKFRIIFHLSRHIESAEIKQFWFALQSYVDAAGDKQCKDLSRMYYTPATYSDAANFIFDTEGCVLDVDKLLERFPYSIQQSGKNFLERLPDALQKQVIAHRKSLLSNSDNITWNSYSDCPFWPKKLAAEYTQISGGGWYAKMYAIMVSTASYAIYRKYPITSEEIAEMCQQFDREHGNWYENRPMKVEADRAIEYAYRNI
jgi:hypothetical protein